MSDQPEITDAELDWMEKAYGGGGVTIGRQEVVRLITEVRRLRETKAGLQKLFNEYAECLQHLCSNVLYEPCAPISYKWPGRMHVENIKDGVEFLLTDNRRLRAENESLGKQCDDTADYSGQRDIEIERLNEMVQSLRGRLDDEAQKPLNEEFECHSDDVRTDS